MKQPYKNRVKCLLFSGEFWWVSPPHCPLNYHCFPLKLSQAAVKKGEIKILQMRMTSPISITCSLLTIQSFSRAKSSKS